MLFQIKNYSGEDKKMKKIWLVIVAICTLLTFSSCETSAERELRKEQERLETINDALDNAQDNYNELKDEIDRYKELKDKLQ